MGIGIDLIRIMLGHATLKSLKHYVAIHDITMIDVMRNIVEEDNQRISLIQNPRNAVDDPAGKTNLCCRYLMDIAQRKSAPDFVNMQMRVTPAGCFNRQKTICIFTKHNCGRPMLILQSLNYTG